MSEADFPGTPDMSPEVLFVSMPFGPLALPSIALGLLRASLAPTGITSRTLYLTISFAQWIGAETYHSISEGEPSVTDLVGEWIFARCLSEINGEKPRDYVRDVLRGGLAPHRKTAEVSEKFVRAILDAREMAPAFIDSCADRIASLKPRLLCFTSVFQQHAASLSLARRLSRMEKPPYVLFGGANCEGPMGVEMLRQFPFVDGVVSGEADVMFPSLVRTLVRNEGVLTSGTAVEIHGGTLYEQRREAAPSGRMDDLPVPDYDEFFQQWKSLSEPKPGAALLFETSRGCWWGEKHHCTFCGLNGATMSFRSKSASRAMSEIEYLVERYPGLPVSVVDNILDMKYFEDFLPALARRGLELDLFYEVKSNLRRRHLEVLRDAGITTIQPGVESLSTAVLGLMRKGVSALQNIQMLKWCAEYGITVMWNMLWGFPGEPVAEYARMAAQIPLLAHLPPPVRCIPVRLDRFSPYFENAEEHGLHDVSPYPSYCYVYQLPDTALAGIAYYFTATSESLAASSTYAKPLIRRTEEWQRVHGHSSLVAVDDDNVVTIFDTRPCSSRPIHRLQGLERKLLIECDSVRSFSQLCQRLPGDGPIVDTPDDVRSALERLVSRLLMIREGDKYLSLTVSGEEYEPGSQAIESLVYATSLSGGVS